VTKSALTLPDFHSNPKHFFWFLFSSWRTIKSMSKFVMVAVGVAEVAGGAALVATGAGSPVGVWLAAHGLASAASILISAGIGTTIAGLGTLLSKGPVNGFATTERNPTAPWRIVYGRARVGGTLVYL
jgi:hypothetical protein